MEPNFQSQSNMMYVQPAVGFSQQQPAAYPLAGEFTQMIKGHIETFCSNNCKQIKDLHNQLIQRQERLDKLSKHLSEGTFPRVLHQRRSYDPQLPTSIAEDIRKDASAKFQEMAIKYKLDCLNMEKELLQTDFDALNMQYGSLISSEALVEKFLVEHSSFNQPQFIDFVSNYFPIYWTSAYDNLKHSLKQKTVVEEAVTKMEASNSTEDPIASLSKQLQDVIIELAALKKGNQSSRKQQKQQEHQHGRKNHSRGGAGHTREQHPPRHAARKRSASPQRSRSGRSRSPARSVNSQRRPRSRSRGPPRGDQDRANPRRQSPSRRPQQRRSRSQESGRL
jgi:hypothetical protein